MNDATGNPAHALMSLVSFPNEASLVLIQERLDQLIQHHLDREKRSVSAQLLDLHVEEIFARPLRDAIEENVAIETMPLREYRNQQAALATATRGEEPLDDVLNDFIVHFEQATAEARADNANKRRTMPAELAQRTSDVLGKSRRKLDLAVARQSEALASMPAPAVEPIQSLPDRERTLQEHRLTVAIADAKFDAVAVETTARAEQAIQVIQSLSSA
ncbi:uncharacterized protein L969DRAFT_615364 [Mixia osmundae IAM 14324]|uniref:Uncharacterized protein n=1 Tax=Mixia osmundae (strain CBS 9802 / IAM 14324 / JCM 22182 / KY 12970) TaxID=764103 RepID=G7DYF1_MIXOS|nr:uncharacterized protein L969DRAFT_615364 [Mixia osmundae IAM 14324]KEI41513.1 hypothetical protein L969DRAFT_615364 [Mixia osmundae IAM 14324]GAA95611.1 hypothetical protein E5Q_02267 [Mixia osmundae IAM 14324]